MRKKERKSKPEIKGTGDELKVPSKKAEGEHKIYKLKKKVRIVGKERMIRVDQIRANTYNYRAMNPFHMDKLKEEIGKIGFVEAITVRTGDENGPFEDGMAEVINGEHRWIAATDLGFEEIPARDLGNVPTKHAKTMCIILNELHGEPNQDNLSRLIAEMSKEEGGEELLAMLPFNEQELEAYSTAGASDMEALEKLGEESSDESGEEEDDGADVAEFLGLYSLTEEEHAGFQRRIEDEVIPRLGSPKRAGQLLDRMISAIVENVEKKKMKKKKVAAED